jgi:hypothetical protein
MKKYPARIGVPILIFLILIGIDTFLGYLQTHDISRTLFSELIIIVIFSFIILGIKFNSISINKVGGRLIHRYAFTG